MDYSSSEDEHSIDDLTDLEADQNQTNTIQSTTSNPPDTSISDIDTKSQYHEPYLGMEFPSDSSAREFYNAYAQKLGFGIRVARSRTERRKGVEVLVMKRFVCLKEGHHKKKTTPEEENILKKKKRRRLSIRDGCPALMEVVRRGPEKWVVNKLVLEHTHVVLSPDRVQASKYIQRQNLLNEMRNKVFGDDGDNDARSLLDYFKRIQLKNKGFFYAIQVDSTNRVANVVWIDARSKVSYAYFGDAVTFDTSYMQNDSMPPLAIISGVNQNSELIIFGYALILDRSEAGFKWIFEAWLTGMSKQHPISITTDQGSSLARAVAAVFPQTFHRFCRWRIFARCKKRLSDLYLKFPTLHEEIKRCVNEPDTVDIFELCWRSIVDKYDLRENQWLSLLYKIRDKWVPAYSISSFFAELCTIKRPESINRMWRGNIGTSKISLTDFLTKVDNFMECRCEKESQYESTVLPSEPILKTDIIMEKQAASVYTKETFELFQTELIHSLHQYPVKIQHGSYSKYSVEQLGETTPHNRYQYTVFYIPSEKKGWCNCNKFSLSGILCRHVLAVFLLTGMILLPDHYITKRWTRIARIGPNFDLQGNTAHEISSENSASLRYGDLVRDAMRCVEKGAVSPDCYKIAKEVMRKALREIAGFERNFDI